MLRCPNCGMFETVYAGVRVQAEYPGPDILPIDVHCSNCGFDQDCIVGAVVDYAINSYTPHLIPAYIPPGKLDYFGKKNTAPYRVK